MSKQIDYQELIDELKDEVNSGSLSKQEIIQVLRSENSDKDGYYQIIDWYYNKEALAIELAPDSSDTKEEIEEKALIQTQYNEDKDKLQDMTVDACLTEMFEKTSVKTKKNRNPFF